MAKFRVHGTTTVEIIVDIDAESYEEAINKANEDFGSINGGLRMIMANSELMEKMTSNLFLMKILIISGQRK